MTEKNGSDIAIFINGRIVTSANFASRCSLYLCVQEFSFVNTKQKRLLVISSAVSSPEHVSLQQQSQAHCTLPWSDGSDVLMLCGYKQIKVSPQRDQHKLST